MYDAGSQLIGDPNLPRRAGRELLAGDEAVRQPAMNARRIHAENLRRLANGNQFPAGRFSRRLESPNMAIAPQAANLVGSEAFARSGLSSLTIQNSGDRFIRIKIGQAPKQGDRIFVGARPHQLESWDGNIQRGERPAPPAQSQMRATFGSLEIQNHFLQQGAQQFLAIAIRGGRRSPYLTNIGPGGLNSLELLGAQSNARAGTEGRGVVGAFRERIVRYWGRVLGRRSQTGKVSAIRLGRLFRRWLPRPKVVHPYPERRFAVRR